MPKQQKDMLVGIDIGTSKVVALVGEVGADGRIEIIGKGTHPSTGLKKGMVVDVESTVHSIRRAVEEAELMAGCQVHSAYTGIAGSHINSLNSHGIVAIKDQEVSQWDVDQVMNAAAAVAIPADQEILHVIPQEFVIDSQDGIRKPVGMNGVRLEARVHMVMGAVTATQNVAKCVRQCGLKVMDIVLEQLASSYAVLTEDEKELGVCLVDIGGGTTDIAIFREGAIRHTAVIPIAGDHVTKDIAVYLRTPSLYAESVKLTQGGAWSEGISPEETLQIEGFGEHPSRQVSKKSLVQVMEARYDELLKLVRQELRRSGFEEWLAAGIVFTGGAAMAADFTQLAENVFHMPVRIGAPREDKITGQAEVVGNPIFATGIGLLLHGLENLDAPTKRLPHSVEGLWKRMKGWFQGNL